MTRLNTGWAVALRGCGTWRISMVATSGWIFNQGYPPLALTLIEPSQAIRLGVVKVTETAQGLELKVKQIHIFAPEESHQRVNGALRTMAKVGNSKPSFLNLTIPPSQLPNTDSPAPTWRVKRIM